jgi:Flp pilus assembly protein TadG
MAVDRMTQRRFMDSGSTTLELVILTPGLVLLIALLALAGRHAIAYGVVDQAAADAARAASLQRGASEGWEAAEEVARSSLSGQDVSCGQTAVSVDTSGLATRPGQAGWITVTVRCSLAIADLPFGSPAITIASTAVSPVDTYRER